MQSDREYQRFCRLPDTHKLHSLGRRVRVSRRSERITRYVHWISLGFCSTWFATITADGLFVCKALVSGFRRTSCSFEFGFTRLTRVSIIDCGDCKQSAGPSLECTMMGFKLRAASGVFNINRYLSLSLSHG